MFLFSEATIIGHRGAAASAPENTLESLVEAAWLGVRCVEFDAKLCGDDTPILMHDSNIDRTTDGHGPVQDYNLEDIQRFDAGSWFDSSFAGCRIPSLREALTVCENLSLTPNIEIKPCEGLEQETAVKVMKIAKEAVDPSTGILPVISSFSYRCVEIAASAMPHWPRVFLSDEISDQAIAQMNDLKAVALGVDNALVDLEMLNAITRRAPELKILVYTVNTPYRAQQLFANGAMAIFSDCPEKIGV